MPLTPLHCLVEYYQTEIEKMVQSTEPIDLKLASRVLRREKIPRRYLDQNLGARVKRHRQ